MCKRCVELPLIKVRTCGLQVPLHLFFSCNIFISTYLSVTMSELLGITTSDIIILHPLYSRIIFLLLTGFPCSNFLLPNTDRINSNFQSVIPLHCHGISVHIHCIRWLFWYREYFNPIPPKNSNFVIRTPDQESNIVIIFNARYNLFFCRKIFPDPDNLRHFHSSISLVLPEGSLPGCILPLAKLLIAGFPVELGVKTAVDSVVNVRGALISRS